MRSIKSSHHEIRQKDVILIFFINQFEMLRDFIREYRGEERYFYQRLKDFVRLSASNKSLTNNFMLFTNENMLVDILRCRDMYEVIMLHNYNCNELICIFPSLEIRRYSNADLKQYPDITFYIEEIEKDYDLISRKEIFPRMLMKAVERC
jgi:hypothetical protein